MKDHYRKTGTSYSFALRRKIIEHYEAYLHSKGEWKKTKAKNLSKKEIAKKYGVSLRFVHKIIKQFEDSGRKSGSFARKFGSGRRRKINENGLLILAEIMEEDSKLGIDHIYNLFVEKTGEKISRTTIWRELQKHPKSKLNPVNRLKTIPGVNKKLAEMLAAVGIQSSSDLKQHSAESAFALLQSKFKRTTKSRLFQLEEAFFHLNNEN